MESVTILYYSSNKEDPRFEEVIRRKLQENNPGLPIVSVTQKPADLGKNICVGDVGASYLNLNRQLQIGAENIATDFVLMAEADQVYPPEYFIFQPENKRAFYDYTNVYILNLHRNWRFRKKKMTEGARMVGREYLLERLNVILEGKPQWQDGRTSRLDQPCPREDLFKHTWTGENPVVAFKTGKGVSSGMNFIRGEKPQIELPYWGSLEEVRALFPNF